MSTVVQLRRAPAYTPMGPPVQCQTPGHEGWWAPVRRVHQQVQATEQQQRGRRDMRAPVWPADWWREALIRPDKYVAMRELLCPMCGKTGHVAGDCGKNSSNEREQAMSAETIEPEWDSQDSNDYHDGYERGEADARTDGQLSSSMRGAMSRSWLEGYEDGREDTEGGSNG